MRKIWSEENKIKPQLLNVHSHSHRFFASQSVKIMMTSKLNSLHTAAVFFMNGFAYCIVLIVLFSPLSKKKKKIICIILPIKDIFGCIMRSAKLCERKINIEKFSSSTCVVSDWKKINLVRVSDIKKGNRYLSKKIKGNRSVSQFTFELRFLIHWLWKEIPGLW